ncbi:MAG: glycine--tRNA ligase [Verrucomicrobiota bacterium]|jgi:glycyl-tRNA synthetase
MVEAKSNDLMERLVALCKRRGFIFQSSEIYGGINGFWDYGPLGAELKRNIKESWWQTMTRWRDDVVGLEATIIMHPKIWEASGHATTFADPMTDCLLTKKRFRADQIEPQSGTVYHFDGARDLAKWTSYIGNYPDSMREAVTEIVKEYSTVMSRTDADLMKDSAKIEARFQKEYQQAGNYNLAALNAVYEEFIKKGCDDPYSVLIATGKHPDYARKIARQFYQQRGLANPQLLGERAEKVENSTRYNPENGSLLTEPRQFNLMFKTWVGPVESAENLAWLRPETAQAIFAQFKNVLEVSRQKIPFGICQIGKAFRNEINPRNFTFRSREFEQMELEFFIRPDEAVEAICGRVAKPAGPGHPGAPQPDWGWQIWHQYWVEERLRFYENIGLPRASLVEYWQKPEELAHYARATVDILYKFPFSKRDANGELAGEELEGIAARSDFDLSQHQRFSGKAMGVYDEELKAAWPKLAEAKKAELSNRYFEARLKYLAKMGEPAPNAERLARAEAANLAKGNYVPHVIEPSAGVDRLALALLSNAYCEDQAPDEKGNLESRVVMRFHPRIAPLKVAVFPLLKNKPALVSKALEVRDLLRPHMAVFYDEAGAIGRRYRRQDEAGTPFGVTIDFETLGEQGAELKDTVTLRDRDTMKQQRVKINDLLPLLSEKIR